MIADEQTHRLPKAERERRRVAALGGEADLRRFDASVVRTLKTVGAALSASCSPARSRCRRASAAWSSPASRTTRRRWRRCAAWASADPAQGRRPRCRAWHHGRIARHAHRARARALHAPGAAPARRRRGHRRAGRGLRPVRRLLRRDPAAGVQVQSLFLAQPRLLELIVRVMAFAPRFARTLARRPAALDALLDPGLLRAARRRCPTLAAPLARAGRLRGGDGRGAPAAPRARLPHRRCRCWRDAPARRRPGEAFADLADACIAAPRRSGAGGDRAAGRRLPGRGGGDRARQVRLARDDRRLRPRPDDALRVRRAGRGVGGQGLGGRRPSTAASPSG